MRDIFKENVMAREKRRFKQRMKEKDKKKLRKAGEHSEQQKLC